MRTIVFDVAATEGGALTVLNTYYKKAVQDESNQFIFVVSAPNLQETENVKVHTYKWVKKSWLHRLFFDYIVAPSLVKQTKADTILSLQNTSIPRTKIPTSIYFHQILPLSTIKFKAYKNPKLWMYQNVIRIFIARSLRKANKVIVQSHWVAETIQLRWRVDKKLICVEPPTFHTNFKYHQTSQRMDFIYPAGPFDYKNHTVILKALNELKTQSPHIIKKIRVSFTLTGNENKYSQSLQNLADSQQLPIEFIGTKSHDDLLTIMSHSILIFPSKLESFGLPMLEAKTMQCPIIASDTPFSREIIGSHESGCFFQADDWQSLAQCIKDALENQLRDSNGALTKVDKILFIGGLYGKDKEEEYLSKSSNGIQGAVNAHQWSIVEGLILQPNTHVEIISAPFLTGYPSFKDFYVQPFNKGGFHSIGYINIPVIREVMRILLLRKKVRSITKETPDAKIVCYYLALPQMLSAILQPRSQLKVLIVPDVPSYLNLSKNVSIVTRIYSFMKRQMLNVLIQRFDKYIILTKYMAEILGLEDESWIVVEGLVKDKDIISEKDIRGRSFNNLDVLYSGSLHEIYGVKSLADAASIVKNRSIQFYFYGTGELSNYLIALEKNNPNIHYMGYVSRNTVLSHQRIARALINPRGQDGEYVWYSFPSKNLEYLASGTPAIFMDLPCIPSEYSPHYIHLENNSANHIASALDAVANMQENELKDLSLGAVRFVRTEKSASAQAKRMYTFINT